MSIQLALAAVVQRKRAQTVESVPANMAFDFSGVADETLMTTTIFDDAKIGGTGWSSEFGYGVSHPTGTPSNIHVIDDATSPSYATPFLIGATLYHASEDQVVRVGFVGRTGDDAKWERFDLTAPGGIGKTATMQFFFKPGLVGGVAGTGIDLGGFETGSGFSLANHVIAGGAGNTGQIHVHSDDGHAAAGPILTADTWYEVTVRHSEANERAEVIVRVASTRAIHYAGVLVANVSNDIASVIAVGSYLVAYDNDEFQYYKGLVFAWSANATMPLGAITIPAPTPIVASQSDTDEVTVSWTAQGFEWLLERNKNSGGWAPIEAARATTSYVDTDVADADVVQYRISTIIGETTGTSGTSDPVTVENAPAIDFEEYFEGTGAPAAVIFTGGTGVDYDYSTDPIEGAQSMQLTVGDAGSQSVWDVPGSSEVWMKMRVRLDVTPTSSFVFFTLRDSSDNSMLQLYYNHATGRVAIVDSIGLISETTVAALGAGENYIWLYYKAATGAFTNDATCRVWHNTTDTKPANGSDNSAGGTTGRSAEPIAHIGFRCVETTGGTWVYDSIQLNNASFE